VQTQSFYKPQILLLVSVKYLDLFARMVSIKSRVGVF
jgi:hypothetical protein